MKYAIMIDFDGKSDYVKGNGFAWSDRDPVLTFDNRTDAEEYALSTWNHPEVVEYHG